MAPRVAGFSKKPEVVKATFASVSASDVIRAPVPLRSFPLALEPVLAPFRKHRKLNLRVERMPQLARLSSGRNNGDGSWTLAPDDLEGLTLQAPENLDRAQTLTVRIMTFEGGDVATLKVLDFPVFDAEGANAAADGVADADAAAAPDMAGLAQLAQIQLELAQMQRLLATRDAELADTRQQVDGARSELLRAEAALTAARAASQAEIEKHVSVSSSQAAEADAMAASAEKRIQEVRDHLQREGRAALLKAEAAWKAEESARVAAAEAQWREQSTRALADVMLRHDAAEKALAETRLRAEHAEQASKAADEAKAELAKVQAELAHQREALSVAQAALNTRDAELARQRADAAAAAGKAADAGKAELARLQEELTRLRTDMKAAQAALHARESELEKQRADNEQVRLRARQESESVLSASRATWLAEEATHLAAAEARWRAQTDAALAEARAQVEAAQLAAVQARTEAGRPLAESEIELGKLQIEFARQREELKAAQAALNARDAELAKQRADAAQAQAGTLQDAESALASARAAWKAEEAQRITAAEARAKEQSSRALSDARARFEAAEAELEKVRKENSGRRATDDAYVERLRGEVTALQNVLVGREAELAQARASIEQLRMQYWPEANVRASTAWAEGGIEEQSVRRANLRLVRDVVVVVSLVMSLVLFWPKMASLLPYEVRAGITDAAGSIGLNVSGAGAPMAEAPPAPEAAPPVQKETAIVDRSVNLRATPSTGGAVVQRLVKGASVTVGTRQGSWTEVEITGLDGKVRQGWVFSSYLSGLSAAPPLAVAPATTASRRGNPAQAEVPSAAASNAPAEPTASAVGEEAAAPADAPANN
jgi:hypothetical protein